jgi:hypothetical protein
MSYDDTLSVFVEYATAIKAVDRGALVAGPALSGWTGLFYSSRDKGADRYRTHADRLAHGDMPFLPWWLDQVRSHDEQAGQRSLDVLDVHYYPQAVGVFGDADDAQTGALRLRSTRSLWDPSYVDESWIGEAVQLIPRLRAWIDTYYPGTRLAIGEWNWGAEDSMSGALAVADVLGIFGREGVDLAAHWTAPAIGSPAAQAFALLAQHFGDQSLSADLDASPDYVTAYASLDSKTGDMLVVILNKRPDAPVSARVKLTGVERADADVFALASGDKTPRALGRVQVQQAEVRTDLAPASVQLVRVHS